MACTVVDRAIQAFGAEGVSQDQVLAGLYAGLRTLRLADVRPTMKLASVHNAKCL
jgi:acyl-CoA dehydrogenase